MIHWWYPAVLILVGLWALTRMLSAGLALSSEQQAALDTLARNQLGPGWCIVAWPYRDRIDGERYEGWQFALRRRRLGLWWPCGLEWSFLSPAPDWPQALELTEMVLQRGTWA
jgi:hypothetical protein